MRLRGWWMSGVVAMMVCPAFAADGAPKGWFLAGSAPQFYRVGVDEEHHAFIFSKPDAVPAKFGTLMQTIRADNYVGKRVRLRAAVKCEGLTEWAALWMRIDRNAVPIVMDNMDKRPIQGSREWHDYEIVEDVPTDATEIAFGAFLHAQGKIWIDHMTLEVVGKDVPVTAEQRPSTLPSAPVNLDFRE